MSKESKGRDRWRQHHAASHERDRLGDFCAGCGYYHAVNGHHRADCTSKKAHP